MANIMHDLSQYLSLDAINSQLSSARSVYSRCEVIPCASEAELEHDIADHDPFNVDTARDMREVCERYGHHEPGDRRWEPAKIMWCPLRSVGAYLDRDVVFLVLGGEIRSGKVQSKRACSLVVSP